MQESPTPELLRRLRGAWVAATISAALTPVAGAMSLALAFSDPDEGWAIGLFFIAVGPSIYAIFGSPLVAGPRSLVLLRLLHRARPLHVALLIAAIAAAVHDGIQGLVSWWWAGVSVVACGCMLMALMQQSAPGPAAPGQP